MKGSISYKPMVLSQRNLIHLISITEPNRLEDFLSFHGRKEEEIIRKGGFYESQESENWWSDHGFLERWMIVNKALK